MTVAIIVQIKNENKYLKDWINYHKYIGIDHIFIIDNNDIDGEDPHDIINIYGDFISYESKRGITEINTHRRSYVDTYNDHSDEYNWFLFIDIDEYLILRHHKSVSEFLSQSIFEHTEQILLSWQIFTDNNIIHYDNRPVMERFTERMIPVTQEQKGIYLLCKPLLRGGMNIDDYDNYKFHNVIRTENPFITMNEVGEYVSDYYRLNDNYSNVAYINHYMTKTIEEFIDQKYNKEDGNHMYKYDLEKSFFIINERTDEKMNYIENKISSIKYTILTCVFNDYDILKDPEEIDLNAEYICVTDDKYLTSKVWKIIYDPDLDTKWINGIQKAFTIKYDRLFDYMSESSKYLIRLDASIQIHKSLKDIIDYIEDNDYDCALMMHPERHNLLDEYDEWQRLRGQYPEHKEYFLNKTKEIYFDDFDCGLIETTLQIYKKNDICKKLVNKVNKLIHTTKYLDNNDQCYYTVCIKDFINEMNILFVNRQIISSDYMDLCYHYTTTIVYNDHIHARGPKGEFIYDLDTPIYYSLYNKTKKIHFF